jgi:TonB family protein
MTPAPPAEPIELNLLRPWREPFTPRRFFRDAGGSLAVHAIILALVIFVPDYTDTPAGPVIANLKRSVTIVAPRYFEPTQKEPNQGKVTRELDVRSAVQGRSAQAPRFRPPVPAPGAPAAPAPVIEAPKIEVAPAPVPQTDAILGPAGAPPPIAERPKIALENVPGSNPSNTRSTPNPNAKLDVPKPSLEELARAATRTTGSGGLTVGDVGELLPNLPGNAIGPECRTCSALQLLSDPQNVDFKPYLVQVLTLVKRNWLAVVPESARTGRRGLVLIQFIIDRRGAVPKLVIASPSGTEAFDRAAVAGVSASYPFPPLPPGYKGDQIRLQLAFAYNMPTR